MAILDNTLQLILENSFCLTGDYGIAIVLITIAIRFLLLPLDIVQRKSAKQSRIISERAERIKKDYCHNPKKKEEELQKLYQENNAGVGMCLITFFQFPIMISLYRVIRKMCNIAGISVLLPWVSSLLVRDQLFILPVVTIIFQILPQTYPYMRMFSGLHLQKQSPKMIVSMMLMSCVYIFAVPSGVGLYCLTSAVFQTVEQFVLNINELRREKVMASMS